MAIVSRKTAGTKVPRIITLGTELVYRTVSKPLAQAETIHKMFEANAKFAGASIEPDRRKAGFYFVAFMPASRDRQIAMHEAFMDARLAKADAGLCTWEWDRQADGSDVVYTPQVDTTTGEVIFHDYRVTDTSCDCPDFLYRCSRVGHACKHMMNRQLRATPVIPAIPAIPARGFGAAFHARVSEDFG